MSYLPKSLPEKWHNYYPPDDDLNLHDYVSARTLREVLDELAANKQELDNRLLTEQNEANLPATHNTEAAALRDLAKVQTERDAYRAVLEGAGYEDLDNLPTLKLWVAHQMGERAQQYRKDLTRERDELRRMLATAHRDSAGLRDERVVIEQEIIQRTKERDKLHIEVKKLKKELEDHEDCIEKLNDELTDKLDDVVQDRDIWKATAKRREDRLEQTSHELLSRLTVAENQIKGLERDAYRWRDMQHYWHTYSFAKNSTEEHCRWECLDKPHKALRYYIDAQLQSKELEKALRDVLKSLDFPFGAPISNQEIIHAKNALSKIERK